MPAGGGSWRWAARGWGPGSLLSVRRRRRVQASLGPCRRRCARGPHLQHPPVAWAPAPALQLLRGAPTPAALAREEHRAPPGAARLSLHRTREGPHTGPVEGPEGRPATPRPQAGTGRAGARLLPPSWAELEGSSGPGRVCNGARRVTTAKTVTLCEQPAPVRPWKPPPGGSADVPGAGAKRRSHGSLGSRLPQGTRAPRVKAEAGARGVSQPCPAPPFPVGVAVTSTVCCAHGPCQPHRPPSGSLPRGVTSATQSPWQGWCP